jgi:hypothetical protein
MVRQELMGWSQVGRYQLEQSQRKPVREQNSTLTLETIDVVIVLRLINEC